MTLDIVNALSVDAFVAAFGGCYEHAPWVAEEAARSRPFATVDAMRHAFSEAVRTAPHARQTDLIRAHPELGHRAGIDPDLGAASASEQAGAGLDRLTPEEYAHFSALNAAYTTRFAMPFIICVRRVATESAKSVILHALEQRLTSTPEDERREALRQIDAIASLRIGDILTP